MGVFCIAFYCEQCVHYIWQWGGEGRRQRHVLICDLCPPVFVAHRGASQSGLHRKRTRVYILHTVSRLQNKAVPQGKQPKPLECLSNPIGGSKGVFPPLLPGGVGRLLRHFIRAQEASVALESCGRIVF